MLGDDQSSHQITRASVLSLSTSSATEPTLWPPWRFAGSSTLSTTRRGAASTPSASGVVVARHLGVVDADLDPGGEGRLRPAEQCRQHLSGLIAVIVDRLLADDDDP